MMLSWMRLGAWRRESAVCCHAACPQPLWVRRVSTLLFKAKHGGACLLAASCRCCRLPRPLTPQSAACPLPCTPGLQVLALQPGSHLLGARQPCSAPARTGWAPASHEDRLLSVSPLGGLPDSCFAEPSGLPFLHPPCTTGQQQQHQQQQWQAQAGGLAEQPSGNAAALGGFAAFSTNLPVSLQVEARPAPTVQQPPVRLAQHPGAAEHQLLGQLEGPAQHRPLPAAPGHPAALSYAPPTSLHRISLKARRARRCALRGHAWLADGRGLGLGPPCAAWHAPPRCGAAP